MTIDPQSFDARAADWDTLERIAWAAVAARTIRDQVTFPTDARAICKISEGRLANVGVVQLDLVVDPPPGGAPFDAVISQLVLHQVKDTAAGLAASRRLLVPGGQAVLLDLDAEDGSFHGDISQNVHHLGFERGYVERLASAAGFVHVDISDGGQVGGAEHTEDHHSMFVLMARAPSATVGR